MVRASLSVLLNRRMGLWDDSETLDIQSNSVIVSYFNVVTPSYPLQDLNDDSVSNELLNFCL